MILAEKVARLEADLARLPSLMVALSGGVDSAVLLLLVLETTISFDIDDNMTVFSSISINHTLIVVLFCLRVSESRILRVDRECEKYLTMKIRL